MNVKNRAKCSEDNHGAAMVVAKEMIEGVEGGMRWDHVPHTNLARCYLDMVNRAKRAERRLAAMAETIEYLRE